MKNRVAELEEAVSAMEEKAIRFTQMEKEKYVDNLRHCAYVTAHVTTRDGLNRAHAETTAMQLTQRVDQLIVESNKERYTLQNQLQSTRQLLEEIRVLSIRPTIS